MITILERNGNSIIGRYLIIIIGHVWVRRVV